MENCVRYLTCLGFDRALAPDDLLLLEHASAPEVSSPVRSVAAPKLEKDDGDIAAEALAGVPLKEAKSMVVESFERIYIDTALRKAGGNVSLAARESGKHRRAFFELMRRYGMSAGAYRRC